MKNYFEIQKKSDMVEIFGANLAREVLGVHRGNWKAKPQCVTIVETKPAFYLGDGDCLLAYGIDLVSEKVGRSHFCGSGDCAINYPEQQVTGIKAPANKALMFVHSYWNGRNTSWTITVVYEDPSIFVHETKLLKENNG